MCIFEYLEISELHEKFNGLNKQFYLQVLPKYMLAKNITLSNFIFKTQKLFVANDLKVYKLVKFDKL